jgi:hypothetical protein
MTTPLEHKLTAAPVSAAPAVNGGRRRLRNPTRWVGARPSSGRVTSDPAVRRGLPPRSLRASAVPPPKPQPPVVDRIDAIDQPGRAVTGHQGIRGGGDLDVPGPFNNPDTGGVANVHQIHFHLGAGSPDDLVPERFVQRTMWISEGVGAAGKPIWLENNKKVDPAEGGEAPVGGDTYAPDGPGEHEIKRLRGRNLLSVADAPGVGRMNAFPFVFMASFIMTVKDREGTGVAGVTYDVLIVKRAHDEVPNKENKITVLKKTDLVRNQDLP